MSPLIPEQLIRVTNLQSLLNYNHYTAAGTALAAAVLFLLSVIWLWRPWAEKTGVPPGILGLPWIGETLAFLGCQRRNQSAQFVQDRVAKHGEVFKTRILGDPMVIIANPAGNKFVFTNENKLVQLKWPATVTKVLGNDSLLVLTGHRAARVRHAMLTFLQPEALRRYAAQVDGIARRFLAQNFQGKSSVVFAPAMKSLTFSIACELLASRTSPSEQEMLEVPFTTMVKGIFSIPIPLPGTRYYKATNAAEFLRRTFQTWIDERRRELASGRATADQDMLSCLLSYYDQEKGKPLSDKEIKDNLLMVLFAGHDTGSSVLAVVCRYLALNPAVLEAVYKENKEIASSKALDEPLNWLDIQKMKLSWRVVQECMRLEPPVQGTFRVSLQDIDYNGFRIPKSWKLYWTVNSTHRNPKYFSNPNEFDPSRFDGQGPAPYTYVPFGGGARMCPGNEFARMEILIFLYHFVTRYSFSMIDPNELISVDPMPFPVNGLPIYLEERVN